MVSDAEKVFDREKIFFPYLKNIFSWQKILF